MSSASRARAAATAPRSGPGAPRIKARRSSSGSADGIGSDIGKSEKTGASRDTCRGTLSGVTCRGPLMAPPWGGIHSPKFAGGPCPRHRRRPDLRVRPTDSIWQRRADRAIKAGRCIKAGDHQADGVLSDSDSHPTAMARRRIAELAGAMRFFSRLPVPHIVAEDDPAAPPSMARMAWAVPVAGALVALPGAAVLWIAHALALPGLLAGALAVLALVATTGALHEDGLLRYARRLRRRPHPRAQARDHARQPHRRLWRGRPRALDPDPHHLARRARLVPPGHGRRSPVSSAASRSPRLAAIGVMALLPPARPGGLSASAGRPPAAIFANAILVAALMALLILGPLSACWRR